MAGKTATLAIKILGDAKDAQRALDDTATSANKLQDGVGKAAVPAAAALAGLAAAGISAAKAAADDQASQAQLALALKNATGASKAQIASTEEWISNTSKAAAVADDELRPALATLARSTGDVEESQKAMGVALDVSAATGKDVESVSTALAKAYAGNTTSLGKLVPGIDKAVLASGDMDAIMAELARTTGGAAATAAGTAAGQMEGMKIQMAEAQEAIGGALLPAMSSLAGVLATVAGWIQQNTTLFLVIGGVVGTFAAAILLLNAAMKVQTILTKTLGKETKAYLIIQRVLNATMWSSPVFLIIAGVVLLVGAIILIATKTTWFQDIWATVWGAIQRVASAAWDGIKAAATTVLGWLGTAWEAIRAPIQEVWKWIVVIVRVAWELISGLVKIQIAILVGIWELIKAPVLAVWEWIVAAIRTAWDLIVAIVQVYIDVILAIWDGIKAGVQAVWDWIKTAIEVVLGVIEGIVQTYIDVILAIWDKIKGPVQAVWDWIKTAIDTALGVIKGIVQREIDGMVAIWEGIKSAVETVWSGIQSAAETALDAMAGPIEAVESAFEAVGDAISDVIDWLGKIRMPKVVQDIVDNIGAIIGGASAEPASRSTGRAFVGGARTFGAAPSLSSSASRSGGSGVTIVVQGALDPVAVARQLREILGTDQRRRAGVVIA